MGIHILSGFWGIILFIGVWVAGYFSWKSHKNTQELKHELSSLKTDIDSISKNVDKVIVATRSPQPQRPKEADKPPEQDNVKQAQSQPSEVKAKLHAANEDIVVPEQDKTPKVNVSDNKSDDIKNLRKSLAELAAETPVQKELPEKETPEAEPKKTASNATSWAYKNFDGPIVRQPKEQAKPKGNVWKKYSNLEFDLGAKLPVWLGSIALIVAGFFFVKYSVENNLVPPYIRLIILSILGVVMVGGAEYIHKRPNFANGRRISQALVGVGLAIIYGVLFAASQIWQYLPVPLAMVGMVLTTLLTLYMSIRYGIGVAYLALITAYLTPILMNVRESSTLFLFAYILGIFAAMAFVAKLQKWWNMLFILLVGNFAWVGYWYYLVAEPNEAIWVNIFLVAQSALIVWSGKPLLSQAKNATEIEKINSASQGFLGKTINFIAHIGGLVFMAQIMHFSSFSMADWAILYLIITASITLAKFDEENYIYLPFAAAVLGGFMFASVQSLSALNISMLMLVATLLLAGFGYYQVQKSPKARIWAFLSTLTSLVYFVIYYLHVGTEIMGMFAMSEQLPSGIIAAISLAASGAFAWGYINIRNKTDIASHNNILANYAATSTAFLALAIAIFIDKSAWPIAFGIQMIALSYIDSQLKNKIIRILTINLATLILLLLLPNLIDVFDYMLELTFGWGIMPNYRWDIEFLTSPLLYMGLPTICFAASAYFMRQHLDNITVKIMETIALTLVTLTGYLVIRYLFNGNDHVYNFNQSLAERGVITSFIFSMGLISFALAKYTGRQGYITRGWLNIAIGFGRIIIFDLLLKNPLLAVIPIEGVTIFNALIFAYALPIIWVFAAEYILPKDSFTKQIKFLKIAASLLFFAFINLNIRFAFHDLIVYWIDTSVAELYVYSIVWLLFGILLLVLAIWKQQKILRYASQIVVMLTVTKVFLFDAANLEGLYRIASFAILGVCLIGISSVYSKYILIDEKAENPTEDESDDAPSDEPNTKDMADNVET